MRFTISRKDLAEELSAAAEFTNKKNIVSLPNAVLLKCEADTLTISTFGPDCRYQGRRHVEGSEDGSTLVSYRQLAKFVWAMPDGELDISSDSGELTVKPIKDKTCQVSIPLLALEAPDELEAEKDVVSFNIPAEALNKALVEVSPPTSTKITRIFPCGIYIEKQGRGIVLTAADGRRLSTTYVECVDVPDFKGSIIPIRVLLCARKVFTGEGVVTVTISKTDIVLTDGEHLVRSALIGLTYPEWRRVIPQDQPYTVTVDAKTLKDAVTRVIHTAGSTSNRIDITIGGGKMLLDCRDNNQAHDEISCEFDGEETHIALNATFLKDALSVMEGQVVIGFSDGKSAVTFRPVESQTVHVIMPMLDLQVQNFHRKNTDNTLALTARKGERKDNSVGVR